MSTGRSTPPDRAARRAGGRPHPRRRGRDDRRTAARSRSTPGAARKLWEFTPRGRRARGRKPQITTATPIADPDRQYVYAGSPTGSSTSSRSRPARGPRRATPVVTYDPTQEKLARPFNIGGGTLIVVTGGYDGDAPAYQGHVVAIDRANGRIAEVFNTLCSDRQQLIDPPSSCPASDSALWDRAGPVVEPDRATSWSRPAMALQRPHQLGRQRARAHARRSHLLHNWTPDRSVAAEHGRHRPREHVARAAAGTVGGRPLAVQGGKDGIVKLLNLNRLDGTTGAAGPRTGGELQQLPTPGGGQVFTQPACGQDHRPDVRVRRRRSRDRRLRTRAGTARACTSRGRTAPPARVPVIAGGLLYVYD